MKMKYIFRDIEISLRVARPGFFPILEINEYQLGNIKSRLEDMICKIEDSCRCLDDAAEDDGLRPKFADGLYNASSELWEIHRYCEEGVDAIDEILKAKRSIEENISFLFEDVNEATKGGVAR